LANVSVTDLHYLVVELQQLRDANSRLQLQLEQASSPPQCLRCVSFEQHVDYCHHELSNASRLLLASALATSATTGQAEPPLTPVRRAAS
jgi:hypothetical protein